MNNIEEIKQALDDDKIIYSNSLIAMKNGESGVYINCYSDCNCYMDTFKTFEEFWKYYGDYDWKI